MSTPSTAASTSAKIDVADDMLRTLALLRERSTLGVAHVAEALSLTQAELGQVLATLQFHGFVSLAPDRKTFEAGPVLREVGHAVATLMPYRDQLRPILESLSSTLGETVHLMTLSGRSAYFLDSVEGKRLVRVAARRGASLEAHLTAGGKALLALMSDEQIITLYKGRRLERRTVATIQSLDALMTDLKLTRDRGYALNAGESEDEVGAVAVALPSKDVWPSVSLSVSIPRSRLSELTLPGIIEALMRSIEEGRTVNAYSRTP